MRLYIYYSYPYRTKRSIWHNVKDINSAIAWLNKSNRPWTKIRAFKNGVPYGVYFNPQFLNAIKQF